MNKKIAKLLAVTASVFEVKPSVIAGFDRVKKTPQEARAAWTYLARKHTRFSTTELGIELDTDHSVVIRRCQLCEELMKKDEEYRDMVRAVEQACFS